MRKLNGLFAIVLGVALALLACKSSTRPAQPAPAAAQAPAAAPAQQAPAPAQAPMRKVEDPRAVYKVPLDDTPVRGPRDALVTIVEFADFECPYCKQVAPVVKQLEQAYRGKVRIAWKHNPLSMHRNAVPAAAVAEEARAEGGDAKFWAMQEKLFALETLDRASLERAAREVGLSVARVQSALAEYKYIDRMRRDQTLAYALGATGTPTFFVNGRKAVGAVSLAQLGAIVDEELRKAQDLVKSGVARREVYARIIEKGATAPVLIAAPAAPDTLAPAPAVAALGGAGRTGVGVPIRPDDPARGSSRAAVTVVEFSDFQCPFCARALPAIHEVEQAFGKNVRVVWKHMPLSFHPNAMPAALAAEAAREQGKFWEMHDKLFAHQEALSDTAYEAYARQLGLDLGRFKASLRSSAVRARVQGDMDAARVAGVSGTPSFVVNGELVIGTSSLRAAVARHLEKAQLAKR